VLVDQGTVVVGAVDDEVEGPGVRGEGRDVLEEQPHAGGGDSGEG